MAKTTVRYRLASAPVLLVGMAGALLVTCCVDMSGGDEPFQASAGTTNTVEVPSGTGGGLPLQPGVGGGSSNRPDGGDGGRGGADGVTGDGGGTASGASTDTGGFAASGGSASAGGPWSAGGSTRVGGSRSAGGSSGRGGGSSTGGSLNTGGASSTGGSAGRLGADADAEADADAHAEPGGIWRPKPGTSWQWQITGIVDTSFDVVMYDIDLFDAVPSARSYSVAGFGTVSVPKGANAGVIERLHAAGRIVICYLDTGAWESYRPDQGLFPEDVKGAQTYDGNGDAWEGERWLDIRKSSWPKFAPLMAARLDLARSLGCDGVEPDQNNPTGNDPGFPITEADQKAWYLEVARLAHERGLSVGQKNGIETTDADTVAAFDWNLNEECNMWNECDVLAPFVAAGKAVFQVEYADEGMSTSQFCPKDNAANYDGLLKYLDLDARRTACR